MDINRSRIKISISNTFTDLMIADGLTKSTPCNDYATTWAKRLCLSLPPNNSNLQHLQTSITDKVIVLTNATVVANRDQEGLLETRMSLHLWG